MSFKSRWIVSIFGAALFVALSSASHASESMTTTMARGLVKRAEISFDEKPQALAWVVSWLEKNSTGEASQEELESIVRADLSKAKDQKSELNQVLNFSDVVLEQDVPKGTLFEQNTGAAEFPDATS